MATSSPIQSEQHTPIHTNQNTLSASSGPSLRKASFANLARFFGLGGSISTNATLVDDDALKHDPDEDEDEQEGDNEIDEESLMWDAQAALIAHQPSLAIQRYTTAALPPICSAAACLALGNLLTRGTGFTSSPPTSPVDQSDQPSRKGKERAVDQSTIHIQPLSPIVSPTSPPAFSRFLHTFFGATTTPTDEPVAPATMTSPLDRKYDLVGNGWAMRKEGKRAVRDVEGMGVAGGWLLLGLGWVVDNDFQRTSDSVHLAKNMSKAVEVPIQLQEVIQRYEQSPPSDEDVIVMLGKSRVGSYRTSAPTNLDTPDRETDQRSTETTTTRPSSTTDLSSATNSSETRTGETSESMDLQTPHSEITTQRRDYAAEVKVLKLIYDLLQPLLHLYRHGHIQSGDPVFLPPLTSAQLPKVLKPVGDHQKRRNAWALGGVVAQKMLQMDSLRASLGSEPIEASGKVAKDWKQLASGVRNMTSYILGMTAEKHLREMYFRTIVNTGHCGLTAADDLVRQAAKRLDIISQTPSEPPTPNLARDGYPFPQMTSLKPPSASSRKSKRSTRHRSNLSSISVPPAPRRQVSTKSLQALSSGIVPSAVKGTISDVSGTGHGYSSSIHQSSPERRDTALDTLRRVSNNRHRRNESNASILSLFTPGSLKSTTSEASPVTDHVSFQERIPVQRRESATETLKRVRESATDLTEVEDSVRWPSISGWTMKSTPKTSPETVEVLEDPFTVKEASKESSSIRNVASSPNVHQARNSLSPPTKQHRSVACLRNDNAPRKAASSASLLCPDMEIAAMDPTLAAAELASALTKHVCCSVCAVKGVNFPECRKCGMRFCSRDCRVGINGAGDGKRHLCGVWATRQKRAAGESGLGINGPNGASTSGRDLRDVPGIAVSMAESLGRTPRANSSVRVM